MVTLEVYHLQLGKHGAHLIFWITPANWLSNKFAPCYNRIDFVLFLVGVPKVDESQEISQGCSKWSQFMQVDFNTGMSDIKWIHKKIISAIYETTNYLPVNFQPLDTIIVKSSLNQQMM